LYKFESLPAGRQVSLSAKINFFKILNNYRGVIGRGSLFYH